MPQDLLQIIRENGGEMKETYGVPVEEIQEGIKHGVRKINIDTDIRLAMTAAVRKYLNEHKSAFDPRDLPEARARGGEGDLQAALRAVRLRRHGLEDQAAAARRDRRRSTRPASSRRSSSRARGRRPRSGAGPFAIAAGTVRRGAMQTNIPELRRIHAFFRRGLNLVEYLGLLAIAFATTFALYEEVMVMIGAGRVTLADLLLMFLYLEVLAMIGQYFNSGQLPVRFPLYIAMVAMARYVILDLKELTEWRMLAVSSAILLLTVAVLVIRYGHTRFPYHDKGDDRDEGVAPGGR